MKTTTIFAASALVAMLSLDSTSAMKSFLKKFPNGDVAFTQALGHVGTTEARNDFGKLFSAEGGDYTEKLCKSKFPGTAMTVGEAFGDPCCTWKANGKADFTVEPFTVPTKKTECAANKPSAAPAASSAAPTPAASSAAPAPATPAMTPAPAGKPGADAPPAGKSDADKPGTVAPPSGAGKSDAGKPGAGKPSKCGVKGEKKRSVEDDAELNDDGYINYDY